MIKELGLENWSYSSWSAIKEQDKSVKRTKMSQNSIAAFGAYILNDKDDEEQELFNNVLEKYVEVAKYFNTNYNKQDIVALADGIKQIPDKFPFMTVTKGVVKLKEKLSAKFINNLSVNQKKMLVVFFFYIAFYLKSYATTIAWLGTDTSKHVYPYVLKKLNKFIAYGEDIDDDKINEAVYDIVDTADNLNDIELGKVKAATQPQPDPAVLKQAKAVQTESLFYMAFSNELRALGFHTEKKSNDAQMYTEWKLGVKNKRDLHEVQLQAICKLYHAQKHYNLSFDIANAELYVDGDGDNRNEPICQFDGDSYQKQYDWEPYFVINGKKVEEQTAELALADITSLLEKLGGKWREEPEGGYKKYGLFYAMFDKRFKPPIYQENPNYDPATQNQKDKIKTGRYHSAPLSIAVENGDARARLRKRDYDKELVTRQEQLLKENEKVAAEQNAEAEEKEREDQQAQKAAAEKKKAAEQAAREKAAAEQAAKEAAEKAAIEQAEAEAAEQRRRKEEAELERKRREEEEARLRGEEEERQRLEQERLIQEQETKDAQEKARKKAEDARIAQEKKEQARQAAIQQQAAEEEAARKAAEAQQQAIQKQTEADLAAKEAEVAEDVVDVREAEKNLEDVKTAYNAIVTSGNNLKKGKTKADIVAFNQKLGIVTDGRVPKLIAAAASYINNLTQQKNEAEDELSDELADLQSGSSSFVSSEGDLQDKAMELDTAYDRIFTQGGNFRTKNKQPIYTLQDFKDALDKAGIEYDDDATLEALQNLAIDFMNANLPEDESSDAPSVESDNNPEIQVIKVQQEGLILSMFQLTKSYFGKSPSNSFDKYSPAGTLDTVKNTIAEMEKKDVLEAQRKRMGYKNYDDIFTFNREVQKIFYLDMFKVVVLLQLFKNVLNNNEEKSENLMKNYAAFINNLSTGTQDATKQRKKMMTFFQENGITVRDATKDDIEVTIDKSISILEEIERNSNYIVKKNGENAFDIDKINTEIISGLTNVYKKHHDLIKKTPYVDNALGRIQMTADFKGLTLSNDIGYHYIGDRDFNGQIKYFHALSICADILNHINNGKKVPDILHERCASEWPLSFQLKKIES